MAKFSIEIEDLDNGKYRVECKPSYEYIMEKHKNGYQITPAEGKTLLVLAAIRKAIVHESLDSKKRQSPIILPGH